MSVRTRLAVSAVTCRHAADPHAVERALAREALADRAQDGHLPVRPRDPRPAGASASAGSAMSLRALVAVVVRLVRALDRDADVGGLLGRSSVSFDAERVEVQAGDLLVEVLGQDVDLLLVLVVLGEQLDLGDRLVR